MLVRSPSFWRARISWLWWRQPFLDIFNRILHRAQKRWRVAERSPVDSRPQRKEMGTADFLTEDYEFLLLSAFQAKKYIKMFARHFD